MGKVKNPSHCVVGANAVVVKDIEEEGITVGEGTCLKDQQSEFRSFYLPRRL